MVIDEVELRVVRVPLRAAFANAGHVTTDKVAVLVTVRGGGVEGYGEGVMEPLPWFGPETVGGALVILRQALIPDLLGRPVDDPGEVSRRWAGWRGNPMAKACLEMALWDLAARQQDRPLWQVLGGDGRPVAVGASIGLVSDRVRLLDAVAEHASQGYRRIKLKIGPGADLDPLTAVRQAFPDLALSADGNSAYTLAAASHLAGLDELDLDYLEQPLDADDLVDHAVLSAQLATPLCLDESLSSPQRVEAALDLRACSVVNVKAGRLGGLAAVLDTAARCRARHVPMWCGGMLELGVGRAHNLHLTTLPGFSLPGDTASASRTYARDIVEQPLEAVDGVMAIPPGPGIGVTLDRGFLAEVTEAVETVRR